MTTGNGNEKPPAGPPAPRAVAVPAPKSGEMVRSDFSGTEVSRTAETSTSAMAAQARASVEARYVMAIKRPRDLMMVRSQLLKDCSRPGFADAAIYLKPVGDGIEGPSIRLAEAAARAMTNIDTSTQVLYDDRQKRIIRVSTTDLESNITFARDVTVPKTMERSKLKPGQQMISMRLNSKNQPVYLVAAETDDDILNAENALASKAMRVCILRLIPGDILDEALREARATLDKQIKEDPDAHIKKMCDRFELELGITPAQIKEYLGHPIPETTIAEVALMRKLFTALLDGETTWAEVLDNKGSAPATAQPKDAAPTAKAAQATTATGATPAATMPAVASPPAKGQTTLTDVAAGARAKRQNAMTPTVPIEDTISRPGPKLVPPEPTPAEEDRGDVPDHMKPEADRQPGADDGDDIPPWGQR